MEDLMQILDRDSTIPALLTLLFLILGLWLIAILPVQAQESENNPGLDLVILIDQSNSMGLGTIPCDTCAPENPTDPNGLRVEVAKAVLDVIRQIMLMKEHALHYQPDINRVSIISFGSQNDKVHFPLTPIQPSEITQINQLKGSLEELYLHNTSFIGAFRLACEQLSCADLSSSSMMRRRAIILITDGNPRDPEYRDGSEWVEGEAYFVELQRRFAVLFRNVDLYVIGVDTTNMGFWEEDSPFWNGLSGQTNEFKVAQEGDIWDPAFSIVAELLGIPGTPIDLGLYELHPYLDSVLFAAFYSDPNTGIQIQYPDGQVVSPTSITEQEIGEHTREPFYEYYRINNPPAGEWLLKKIGEGEVEHLAVLTGTIRLADFETEPVLSPPCLPFTLRARFLDAGGEPVPEEAEYPIVHRARIHIPSQALIEVDLQRDPNDSMGEWTYNSTPIQPTPNGGAYPVDFRLFLKDSGVDIFTATGLITIDNFLPCFQLTAPKHGEEIRLQDRLTDLPVVVQVEVWQGTSPGDLSDIFQDLPSKALKASVLHPSGYEEPFTLAADPAQIGVYVAWLDSLKTQGPYTITASMSGTLPDGRDYAPFAPESVTFVGLEDPLRSTIYRVVTVGSGVLVAFFLLILLLLIQQLLPPFPQGSLVVEYQAEPIAEIFLGAQRTLGLFRTRRFTIRKGFPVVTGIQWIKVKRYTTGTRKRRKEGVEVETLQKWDGTKRKGTRKLTNEQNLSLAGSYSVRYQGIEGLD